MEVLARSGRQEATTGKLSAQAPPPISCGDWDTIHFEPSAKEEKTQKGPVGPIGYANEDNVTVAHRDRKEKGAYRPHIMCQQDVADPGWDGGPKLQASGQ